MRVFPVNQCVTESVTEGVTGEQKRAGREDGFLKGEKTESVTGSGHRSVTNAKKSAGSESNQRSRDFELCNSVLVTRVFSLLKVPASEAHWAGWE